MGIIENWFVIVAMEDEEEAEDKNKYNGFVAVDVVAAKVQSGRTSTAKESGALLRNSRSHRATELLSTRHSNSVDSSTLYGKKRRNRRFSLDFCATTRNRSSDDAGQKVATMRCLDSKNVNCRRVKYSAIVKVVIPILVLCNNFLLSAEVLSSEYNALCQ